MKQKVLVALSLLAMSVSFGGYFWQSKKIEVRTPLESAASSSETAPSPPTQYGPELANAPSSNQEALPKLVQIDRSQSDKVVPTPIALTQTNLIPALPTPREAASVPALEATQDGRLRYKAILSFVNDIKVVAQTDGIILDILVDEGTAVSKDTIMIQIDNRLAVAEREVASKELESAKLKAEDDSQIKFSVASYEVATSVFNRSQELFAKVVEAQEEWEKKRLEKIKAGLTLEDGEIKVDDLAKVTPDGYVIGVKIHSGKNRIVRRIFEHLGYEVTKLDRTTFAGLTKKDLPRGSWRYLTERELVKLKYLL
jgi:hypothetical protein